MQRPIKTADGSFTLHSTRYEQTYHSIHGALKESEHVFLEGSGVLERLKSGTDTGPIRILEVGLGLGLNAMVTAAAALQYEKAVEYVGIEHDFQPTGLIAEVLSPFDPDAVQRFCRAVAESSAPTVFEPASLNDYCTLRILPIDLNTALTSDATRKVISQASFNAVYLDAFSPDSNPECWNFDTLKNLAALLISGGNLATYCAKGSVRRDLESAGLNVTRRPGPPGKRECLVARA